MSSKPAFLTAAGTVAARAVSSAMLTPSTVVVIAVVAAGFELAEALFGAPAAEATPWRGDQAGARHDESAGEQSRLVRRPPLSAGGCENSLAHPFFSVFLLFEALVDRAFFWLFGRRAPPTGSARGSLLSRARRSRVVGAGRRRTSRPSGARERTALAGSPLNLGCVDAFVNRADVRIPHTQGSENRSTRNG